MRFTSIQDSGAASPRDAILIQTASDEHAQLLSLTSGHHERYAQAHNMDYLCCFGRQHPERHPYWDKIFLLRTVLHHWPHRYVVWLDADTLIVDTSQDLRSALPEPAYCGMVQHGSPPYFNAGAIYLRHTPQCVDFLAAVWNLWPVNDAWEDNAAIIRVSASDPQRWQGVVAIDNRWNCTPGLNDSDAPVVQGWHGCGSVAIRLEAMRTAYTRLKEE